jgi:CelD/BcsL family acetyltransferase involved in cellulose biosynthesis
MTSAVAFDGGPATVRAAQDSPAERLVLKRLDVTQLRSLDARAWDALSAAALVENPFYDRRHVMAGIETLDRSKPVRAFAFETANGQLVGLFLTQPRTNVPQPFPVANSLANHYQFGGTPLVHREHADAVIHAWADQVRNGKLPGLWALADVDTGSAVTRMMQTAAEARGLSWRVVIPYERAHLTKLEGGFEAHLEQVLSKNRLKDVRRTMRRLAEVGKIELEHVEEPAALKARLDDFLKLEHSGWKGQMGTSFLSHDIDAAFARGAYAPGLASMDSLLLDGQPLAMKLSIRTGRTAYTPKIAYNEDFKKLGPGMALEYMLIEAFYAGDTLDGVDAAATAEGHSALNFFNNHKVMGTVIVGRQSWQVALLGALHEGRKALKHKVKTLQAEWKARREKSAAPPAPAAASEEK